MDGYYLSGMYYIKRRDQINAEPNNLDIQLDRIDWTLKDTRTGETLATRQTLAGIVDFANNHLCFFALSHTPRKDFFYAPQTNAS